MDSVAAAAIAVSWNPTPVRSAIVIWLSVVLPVARPATMAPSADGAALIDETCAQAVAQFAECGALRQAVNDDERVLRHDNRRRERADRHSYTERCIGSDGFYSRGIESPPSTWMMEPVAYGRSPRTSAATTRPTSSGCPHRRSGTTPSAMRRS